MSLFVRGRRIVGVRFLRRRIVMSGSCAVLACGCPVLASRSCVTHNNEPPGFPARFTVRLPRSCLWPSYVVACAGASNRGCPYSCRRVLGHRIVGVPDRCPPIDDRSNGDAQEFVAAVEYPCSCVPASNRGCPRLCPRLCRRVVGVPVRASPPFVPSSRGCPRSCFESWVSRSHVATGRAVSRTRNVVFTQPPAGCRLFLPRTLLSGHRVRPPFSACLLRRAVIAGIAGAAAFRMLCRAPALLLDGSRLSPPDKKWTKLPWMALEQLL